MGTYGKSFIWRSLERLHIDQIDGFKKEIRAVVMPGYNKIFKYVSVILLCHVKPVPQHEQHEFPVADHIPFEHTLWLLVHAVRPLKSGMLHPNRCAFHKTCHYVEATSNTHREIDRLKKIAVFVKKIFF